MHSFLNQFSTAAKRVFRFFRKNWFYGTVSLAGLAIAFATLILVIAYLYQETTYEAFHQKAQRIYRPTYHVIGQNDFEVHWARIPVDYINYLPDEMPEIETLIRFQNQEQKYVRVNEERFLPKRAYVTDPEVFAVFDLPLLSGDPASALSDPYSVVLSESTSEKYFSRTDVVGEMIRVLGNFTNEEKEYRVTGVMRDLPVNTHLPIDILFSFTSDEERQDWAYVYTLLREHASISQVEAKMEAFVSKYADPERSMEVSIEFQPVTDIHLHSHLAREIKPNGQITYVRIFFWVGLFIWIIAIVNFTNLNSAMVMGRGKEMGVRKVLGAAKMHLVLYSMVESMVYSLFALVIGAIIAFLCFPLFGDLTGIVIYPPLKYFIPGLLGLSLITGILAGILPSLVMTSVDLLQILKGGHLWGVRTRSRKINVKRVMITFQFCTTLILIGSAVVGYRQFQYINEKNLGLSPDQVIAISNVPDEVTGQYLVFRNRLQEEAGVREISACMQVPSSEIRDVGPVLVKGVNKDIDLAPMMDVQIIDPDFAAMMQLEIVAGKDLSASSILQPVPKFTEDFNPSEYLAQGSREYLINQSAARQLGWEDPPEAVGKEISWSIGPFELAYGPIVGVIKDYHQESLRNRVDPTVMVAEPIWLRTFLIKVSTADVEGTIAGIQNVWNELFPFAFEYTFLDEMYQRLYSQDRIQLTLLGFLALISILLSMLGLISLVAYALKTKAKELAIRRVIGGDLHSLTMMMAKEYFWILIISAILGIPISYYLVSGWLENFAYHIKISPLVYVGSFGFVLVLVISAIYIQTLKATRENPVLRLREE